MNSPGTGGSKTGAGKSVSQRPWFALTMPSVLIEVRQQYSKERECAIMEAVHSALREAFKILPGDRNVRLAVHEPHRFECPPGRTNPELYTHISIDAFAGRSLDAKRCLYRNIVKNL